MCCVWKKGFKSDIIWKDIKISIRKISIRKSWWKIFSELAGESE